MTPQQSIAHYRITSKLGQGGMGEVYRATDTKLGRDVALKVIPEAFAQDADRMARFTREAQVLASLNHPNIAAIYGVEERALVMELVPGPTLAERIAQGPIPLEETLPIVRQIADALEYAHERGVIHRDLKPANIKITPEGQVKVLDFGLAKAITGDAPSPDPMSSPTLTMRATMLGAIMGTAAYMSPEQARGQNVDRRADIWSFGVVLYEMLTGRVLFAGPTISDTLAAVLKAEIDVRAVPPQARPTLEQCLRRELRERWRSIGDVILALDAGLTAVQPAATREKTIPWIVAVALAISTSLALAGWWRAAQPAPQPLTRLSVDLGSQAVTGLNITVAISPDGRRLVYPARGPDGRQQLATRLLEQEQPTLMPGTDNGFDPFFSPDGQSIGFFAGAQLKKVSVHGGVPVALRPATFSRGASWSDDGNIVAAVGPLTPLSRLPSAGGTPQAVTKLRVGALSHRWPQVLPGGKAVIYTAGSSFADAQGGDIEVVTLRTGEVKVLHRGGYSGRYLPSGHLVYVSHGVLFGVGFDPERLEVRGTPTPLVEDLAANPATGGAQFDCSQTGTLVYLAGKGPAQSWQLAWLDSSGKAKPLNATPGAYVSPKFSPNGRKLTFTNAGDIYIQDFERDATVQLTSTGQTAVPVWTPDGKHIVFQSGSIGLSWIRSDGAAAPQRLLLESPNSILPYSFSPDGRRLLYTEILPETGTRIWTLPLDTSDPNRPKPGKPELFLSQGFSPRFSPDGRWIAYRSSESGSDEINVRPFPSGAGGKWQVSTGGGLYAFWSNNRRELFYETTDNRIMVVDYTVQGDSFAPGKPRLWSDKQIFYPGSANLDLAPDGKRFAVLTAPETTPGEKGSVHVTMLQNFFDELRRRIPAGGK